MGLAVFGSYQYDQNVYVRTAQTLTQQRQTFRVLADSIKIDDRVVRFVGQTQLNRANEAVTVIVKDTHTLQQIRAIRGTTVWQIQGEVQPLLPATNQNQYDWRRYYHQHRVYNRCKVTRIESITPVGRVSLIDWCHNLRTRLSCYFMTMPQPLASYCQQLLIGQHDPMAGQAMQDVKRLGIIHLFCISGMHVFLLVAIVRRICTYLWLERETADGLVILLLPVYLIIAGGSISVVRAVLMAELGLCRRFLKIDALDCWSLSLLAGLVVEPELGLTLGGQLSYLLSFILQVLEKNIQEFKQTLMLALVSLPSILSFCFEFHWLSLVLSYPIIPFFSFVLFPLTLVCAVTYAIWPTFGYLVNGLIKVTQILFSQLASLPGEVHFGKPPLFLALLLLIGTLWCLQDYRCRLRWLLLGVSYLLCFACLHCPLNGEVTFVDIGQGDCIIIRTPLNRQVVMIDTGGKLQFGQQTRHPQVSDLATQTSINYLKSKGIHHLDTVYLSHHDVDHIGYLPTVLRQLNVDKVIVPAGMERQAALVRRVAVSPQTKVIPTTDSQSAGELRVLHPFSVGQAQNEDSLVLAGKFGQYHFLFTGDLDRENELKVLQRYPDLRCDVLKLGHHGSRTASDPEFLRRLGVSYGIISAGRFNRYHHPNDKVVLALHELGVRPLSTQQYGMISYLYTKQGGYWRTTLKGDEIKWTLPDCLNK